MIYELALVTRPETSDDALTKMKALVSDIITNDGGEVLVNDDWGVKYFAQPTSDGKTQGRYTYLLFHSNGNQNTELERRFKLSEDVMKYMIIKAGTDAEKDSLTKNYIDPAKKTNQEDFDKRESDKEKRLFSKKRSCYFSAKKTQPDWKDPQTYSWLVNEFGKINPARVTGLRPRYQRMATTAIKRGRCIGLVSYVSNHIAR